MDQTWIMKCKQDFLGRRRTLWPVEKLALWRLPGHSLDLEFGNQEERGCQEQDFHDGVARSRFGLGSHGPGLRADYRPGADRSHSRLAQSRMHLRRTPNRPSVRQFGHWSKC